MKPLNVQQFPLHPNDTNILAQKQNDRPMGFLRVQKSPRMEPPVKNDWLCPPENLILNNFSHGFYYDVLCKVVLYGKVVGSSLLAMPRYKASQSGIK